VGRLPARARLALLLTTGTAQFPNVEQGVGLEFRLHHLSRAVRHRVRRGDALAECYINVVLRHRAGAGRREEEPGAADHRRRAVQHVARAVGRRGGTGAAVPLLGGLVEQPVVNNDNIRLPPGLQRAGRGLYEPYRGAGVGRVDRHGVDPDGRPQAVDLDFAALLVFIVGDERDRFAELQLDRVQIAAAAVVPGRHAVRALGYAPYLYRNTGHRVRVVESSRANLHRAVVGRRARPVNNERTIIGFYGRNTRAGIPGGPVARVVAYNVAVFVAGHRAQHNVVSGVPQVEHKRIAHVPPVGHDLNVVRRTGPYDKLVGQLV